jgi:hypothetical protein
MFLADRWWLLANSAEFAKTRGDQGNLRERDIFQFMQIVPFLLFSTN